MIKIRAKRIGGAAVASAGNPASITFVGATSDTDDANAANLSINRTITSGNLILIWTKWETSGTIDNWTDGTNTFTPLTINTHANGLLKGRWCYRIATSSGSQTFTPQVTGTTEYGRAFVIEISATGGTLTLDAGDYTADGTGTSLASASISTTSATSIVLGGIGAYTAETFSNQQIGGSAATMVTTELSDTAAFYRILSSIMSNGTATISMNTSAEWIDSIISFKVV